MVKSSTSAKTRYSRLTQQFQIVYLFTARGKLIILDDRYLHTLKQIDLGRLDVTYVLRINTSKYLIGTKNGKIEMISLNPTTKTCDDSKVFYHNLHKVLSIRWVQPKAADFIYFAYRTDQNDIFIFKSTDKHPITMLNIDSRTIDVCSI